MKKVETVSLSSFLFLLVASLVAYVLRFTKVDTPWTFIGIGLGLLVISGVFAFFAKKSIPKNIICFAASAISLGFLIRAWYIFRSFDNPLWMMLLVSLACVAYLWVFYALSHISLLNTHFKTYVILFLFLTLVGYIVLVATTKTTFVSTFGFYLIIEVAFIFAMCKSASDKATLIRSITLSTYSVFAVAVIIIVLILLNGDADFDLDFDIGSDFLEETVSNKKKKNDNPTNIK